MIRQAAPGDALFCSLDLPVKRDHAYIAIACYASLGFAVPASIGAQVTDRSRLPVVLVGDGVVNDVLPWNDTSLVDLFGAGRSFLVDTEEIDRAGRGRRVRHALHHRGPAGAAGRLRRPPAPDREAGRRRREDDAGP